MIRLHRVGGRPPVDDELVEIADDGSVAVRRTISRAAPPLGPVGRFAGHLDRDELERLMELSAAIAPSDDIDQPVPAGAARDEIEIPGARAIRPAGAPFPGPWADLALALREALTRFRDSPVAALAVTVVEAGQPELVHVGSQPLDIDLSGLVVRASTWREGQLVEAGDTAAPGPRDVVAGPGWRHRIEVPLPTLPPGVSRQIELEGVLLGDGETWRVCSLEAEGA